MARTQTASISLLLASASLTNAAVIIGGDTNNGNFNNGTGDSATDQWSFEESASWVNLGTGPQSAQATRINPVATRFDGSRNAVIAENAGRAFGMDTGYTIRNGDVFDLSYLWRDAFNWDDTNDQVIVSLFTSEGDVFGIRNTLVSDGSTPSTSNNSYQLENRPGFFTASAAQDGKTLFVSIDSTDGNGAATGFARLDNFELNVTSIPEPTSLTLAITALGLIALSRRRSS